jgi:lipopolysaccharide export system permease protein
MNILDRYFLREFFKPLGVCLVALLLCLLVHDLFDNVNDFIKEKVALEDFVSYYLILIPAWVVTIMPITLLLSLLYVLSSMSKNGELTAMRASGLDFIRLMTPYAIVGICFSIQMLSLNLAWAPNALQKAQMIFEKSTKKTQASKSKGVGITYRHIASNRFWSVSILDVQTGRATGIDIIQSDAQQRDRTKISATSGFYKQGFWTFQNVIIYDYTLPISDPNNLILKQVLVARDFTEAPAELMAEFKKTKRMTTRELLDKLRYAELLSPKQKAVLSTEFHSRISFPIANFVVFLIGVPFGVVAQRRSTFLAIVNALLFFAGYLLASKVLMIFGQSARIPGWIAAWLPNILFALAGIMMIRKIR